MPGSSLCPGSPIHPIHFIRAFNLHMGSISILSWQRCACGKSTWPQQDGLCLECITKIAADLGDGGHMVAAARRKYYVWILKSPGALRKFTYYWNGRLLAQTRTSFCVDHMNQFSFCSFYKIIICFTQYNQI